MTKRRSPTRGVIAGAAALALANCQCVPEAAAATPSEAESVSPADEVERIHDAMVAELLPYDLSLRGALGEPIAILPPDTLEFWQGVAQRGAQFRASLKEVDTAALNDEDRLTQAYLIKLAESLEDFPRYWLYSFPVTPYSGGWRHNNIRRSAVSAPLANDEDRSRYRKAVSAYAAHVRSQVDKLEYQASKGIRVAQPAIPSARRVVASLHGASSAFIPASSRLAGLDNSDAEAYRASIDAVVEEELKPAFLAMAAVLDDDYAAAAPANVGMMHQAGGAERYRELVRLHTGTDLSPEDIHAVGKQILKEAQEELERIKAAVGFEGTDREFAAMADADPRFAASTPAEVEAHFARAIKRIEPELPRYFSLLPKAPYTSERAPPEIEQGMTFGFYRPPTPELPIGAYLYNGSNPEGTSYVNAAALIYHELLPGHHFQIALQLENEDLPILRRANAFLPLTAYVEGWAEYSADLAGEMGMYPTPLERFGRLFGEMFLANRLVADTGLNGMGWSLEDARTFMQENTFASEAEIETELLRYSTDIPGQALAYAMGHRQLLWMREDAQAALGEDFSYPEFHAQVLSPGALPMDLLDARLKRWHSPGE